MILTYERFSFFKDRKITQDDIDLISDLFLEISDGLKEINFVDRYDMENGVEEDSFCFLGVLPEHYKNSKVNGWVDIEICLSFSDTEGHLGGISWLSDEIEQKQKIMNKKIYPFVERLKKYGFKVRIDLPENRPELYKLHIFK